LSKLPIQKKILREDVKEAPPWIEKILYPVNSFFENVYQALSKNITFRENIASQIKELEFETLAGYTGDADAPGVTPHVKWRPITFPKTIRTRADGVILLQIVDLGPISGKLSSYRPIEGDVCLDWIENNGEIVIGLIRGLTASKGYRLRVLVI